MNPRPLFAIKSAALEIWSNSKTSKESVSQIIFIVPHSHAKTKPLHIAKRRQGSRTSLHPRPRGTPDDASITRFTLSWRWFPICIKTMNLQSLLCTSYPP
ncbi:uncharacterized protein LOC130974272 isoform X2 [Arachis stenosperma]|uniref:uncharacterized protein LOC130974272 isoform X2 n=1 Tax=Arachis stenosperma TaxID=217475 RepID=UPI0025AC2762|nr:uncharacterized protein LOC130974272 isoform X2 [Arachis stenosperma]